MKTYTGEVCIPWKRSALSFYAYFWHTQPRFVFSKKNLTSSPLQALLLLNDPQFIEAARVMAENSILSKEKSIDKN